MCFCKISSTSLTTAQPAYYSLLVTMASKGQVTKMRPGYQILVTLKRIFNMAGVEEVITEEKVTFESLVVV